MENVAFAPKLAPNVRVLPQKLKDNILPTLDSIGKKKRVCGYARVSTNQEEQESSYDAQIDYYTNYIKANPEWEFVGLFADEGISGCNTKKRIGFQNMIKDALDGKIDLIVTKSISRFARNTVDALINIRKLKEKGVEVYFEKEGIYTFDSKGELLISLLSSIAQEEARSISTNTRWGKMKSFADGKVYVGYKTFLGYDKGTDGKMVVNKEEAKTIKFIYQLFLKGYSLYTIKKELEKNHLKTPFGKDKWHVSTIKSQLSNEKYMGDAILQKNYTVDFLTKKYKKNDGELPQYYVSNDHEAIIDKATFDYVQIELKKRLEINKQGIYNRVASRYSGINIFSGKIVCGECGSFFGRKVWHSNDKYKKIIYRCNHKYDGGEIDGENSENGKSGKNTTNKISTIGKASTIGNSTIEETTSKSGKISTVGKGGKVCTTGIITEEEIKDLFVSEYNKLDVSKAIKNANEAIKNLTNTDSLDSKLKEEKEKATSLANQINELIDKNSRVAMNQDEFKKEKERLNELYSSHKKEVDKLEKEIEDRKARKVVLDSFINNIKNSTKIKEFDEGLFCALVECVIIRKNGAEIRWKGMG